MGELINLIPYFEAIKKVMNGTPISNLGVLKENFEKSFYKGLDGGIEPSDFISFLDSTTIDTISFAVTSENSMLFGYDLDTVYGGFGKLKSDRVRKLCQGILETNLWLYDHKCD